MSGALKRRGLVLGASALLSLGLSGCVENAAGTGLRGPGYGPEFEELRSSSPSDFLREVLADDEISEAEVIEARSRFVQCVGESGRLAATDLTDGGFEYTGPAIDAGDHQAIIDACNEKTSADTITMYALRMHDNPENVDPNALIALCLVKKKVVDHSYGGEQYAADMEHYFALPESQRPGVLEFPSFVDEENGPAAHSECIEMSATEILQLPG
ncbi:hypothetical protein M3T53_03305 [Actinomyces sp. B33]|uniref:hypothetical protein n=1 Tax=Actinomyces sp. B33 TaxID=2942131 RepID=UPI0023403850|nr:hypothetical protein [Actinomyces sp. B33]MDC4232744.1 hypothetical protein [Actinomyces sp. B33]